MTTLYIQCLYIIYIINKTTTTSKRAHYGYCNSFPHVPVFLTYYQACVKTKKMPIRKI